MNNKYDNIYELNVFNLTDSEWKIIVMSDVPNYNVMDDIIKEFRGLSWYNNIDDNDWDFINWYSYTFEELWEFINEKWYFFYIPRANVDIAF